MKLNLTNKILENLTNDQKDALQFLKEFIEGNEPVAVISGSPGTGKTYLMDRFNRAINCLVGISAPTHRAKIVLESRLGLKGKTIQSLLGLRPNTELMEFNIDNLIFEPLMPPDIQNYQLVIIDECSQLTKGIIKLIEKFAILYGVKIIFVGDKNQLPAVIKNSTIVEEPVVFTMYDDNMFELREVVRQEMDNPLLQLIIACRNDIETGSHEFESMLKTKNINSNSKNKGYCYVKSNKFKESLIKEYLKVGENNINYIRTLTYTNACATKWNSFLRDNLLGNDLEILNINDILTAYNTILNTKTGTNLIANSNDYLINELKHTNDTNGLKIFKIKLIDCITKEVTPKHIKVVDHTDLKSFEQYYKKLLVLHDNALKAPAYDRKKAWSEYYKYKNNYLSLQSFKLNGSEMSKDLDYGYAITTHKSQGGTFDRVAIDLPDIYSVKNEELRRRLIYVALSRAKDVAYISA